MQEIRSKARERVKSKCKVCRVCNGVACAGDMPGMGGIGSGATFQNNVAALARWQLNMRVLHTANTPNPALSLWGRKLALPVMAAPVGSVAVHVGSDMGDVDYTRLMLEGCKRAGTMGCVGDLPDAGAFGRYMRVVGANGDEVIPFIKPWADLGEIMRRMDYALKAGVRVCGMDVDAPGLPALREATPAVGIMSPSRLGDIINAAHQRGLKFIVKGIMTVDDALLAADAGADAIVVSNHGGRVLDHCPGTAEVLPEIAAAVGRRVIVMLDGGVRTGVDVFKALALGAQVVLICRPVVIAVHGDEHHGLPTYFATLRDELTQAMRLTGYPTITAIDGKGLRPLTPRGGAAPSTPGRG